MANPNLADMTEEDAADLQFPKGYPMNKSIKLKHERKDAISISDSTCHICKSILVEPYIRCAVCTDIELCPSCFANGCEINEHKNNHDYMVIRNEFPLCNGSGWTAKQELDLLNVLHQCGFGNWVDIGCVVNGKSEEECKMHYLQHYVNNQTLPGLPTFKETEASLFSREVVPYMCKLQDVEEPPRFAPDTINARLLAGYNAARSDFEVNFDNHAESLVSYLEFNEFHPGDDFYELGRSLQAGVVQAYNHRLKERVRRRRIIRNHGLIAPRKIMSWIQRYDNTITRPLAERLLKLMQLIEGVDFDYVMEGLHRVGEMKNYINKLLEFRKNGLKHFHCIPMFQKLSKFRQENEREKKQYLNNPEYNWKNALFGGVANCNNPIPSAITQRKIAPPLAIKGLPGYEKLTDNEKDLCSVTRVVPASYLDFKHLLITENKKSGSLRLAQARVLLKIDVNKTRKIYDFLAEEGYINKPIQ